MIKDTIYRQEAIDEAVRECNEDGAYGLMDTKSIVELLRRLPSAQGMCRDCQWYSEEYRMCTEHGIEDRDDSGYCSDGVPRKGGNDETD